MKLLSHTKEVIFNIIYGAGVLIVWLLIIIGCAGFWYESNRSRQRHLDEQAAPLYRYLDQNQSRVKVLYISEGLVSKNKLIVVHCVVEGVKTKERQLIKLETRSNRIPLPNETWTISVDRIDGILRLEYRNETTLRLADN